MNAGWSTKPQFFVASENPRVGAFSFFSSTRSSLRDQNLPLCRSFGDKVGLHDTASLLEIKTALVENLVGAFINATEILNMHDNFAGIPPAQNASGFQAPGMHDDLDLLAQPCHAIPQNETFHLLSHDMISHGSNAESSCRAPFTSLRGVHEKVTSTLQSGHKCHSVESSGLQSDDDVKYNEGLSAKESSSNVRNYNFRGCTANSEEDFLLQEARLRDFREQGNFRQAPFGDDHIDKTRDASLRQNHTGVSREHEPYAGQEEFRQLRRVWSCAETLALSVHSNMVFGAAAASLLIAGALFLTVQSRKETAKRPSVKRRILKSQWYGSNGSQAWGHRTFPVEVSGFQNYQMLDVDCDKNVRRTLSDSIGAPTAFFKYDRFGQPDTTTASVSSPKKAQGQPIRQAIPGSQAIPARMVSFNKDQVNGSLVEKASKQAGFERMKHVKISDCQDDTRRGRSFSRPRVWLSNDKASGRHNLLKGRSFDRLDGKSLPDLIQENVSVGELKQKTRIMDPSKKTDHGQWGKDDELDLDERIKKLYQTIQAVEQNRRAAMLALDKEKQRSMALEGEVLKQKNASAMLGEEVRLLRESHNALLTQLRKKYRTTAAARTAADLVYQDWERHVAAE